MSAAYYVDAVVTLYHGDALDILPTITSAGCLILDPPYHMSPSTFRGIDDGAASSIATPVRLLTETFRHAYRVLPDGGAAFIFCDWRRGPDTTYLATLAGLRISTCVAWTRNRTGTGGMFRGAWDPIYVASKGVPSIRDKAAIPNVVNADHPTDKDHPYEKPVKVWDHLLSRIPETTVLDAFAGSCSSADVAVRHGHKWVGIEADERHCESAARRFDQGTFDFDEAAVMTATKNHPAAASYSGVGSVRVGWAPIHRRRSPIRSPAEGTAVCAQAPAGRVTPRTSAGREAKS